MKTSLFFAAAGATSAAAQSTSTYYEYYDSCTETSSAPGATGFGPDTGTATGYPTVTATDIITYCPICEDMGMKTFGGGSYTIYTTSYVESCPTGGLQDHTYTITEPCPSAGLDREAPMYIPQGFTTTTIPCGCKENTQVPITTPGPAYMSAAAKAPAAAPAMATAAPAAAPAEAPASGGSSPAAAEAPASGGSSPAAAEAPASGSSAPAPAAEAPSTGGSSPAEAPAEAPASGGSSPAEAPAAAPYPLPAAEGKVAMPSGSGAPSNGSTITPFTGVASQLTSVFSVIATLIMMITAFAFAL